MWDELWQDTLMYCKLEMLISGLYVVIECDVSLKKINGTYLFTQYYYSD